MTVTPDFLANGKSVEAACGFGEGGALPEEVLPLGKAALMPRPREFFCSYGVQRRSSSRMNVRTPALAVVGRFLDQRTEGISSVKRFVFSRSSSTVRSSGCGAEPKCRDSERRYICFPVFSAFRRIRAFSCEKGRVVVSRYMHPGSLFPYIVG